MIGFLNKKAAMIAGLFATSLLATPVVAQTACGKAMTDAQKVQRLSDVADIMNVTSAHEYYHGAAMHREELDNIWSKRDDISWTNNTDKYNNRKSLYNFYAENLKNFPLKGALWYHMLTTPYVEVAGDGKTAKAIFMSFGNVSGSTEPGQGAAQWTQEKYAMDLVKENGEWKIWHLRTYVDYYSNTKGSWINPNDNIAAIDTMALQDKNPDGTFKAGVQKEANMSFEMVRPDEKKLFYPAYTLDRMPQYNPAIPKAYCTFSEVQPY